MLAHTSIVAQNQIFTVIVHFSLLLFLVVRLIIIQRATHQRGLLFEGIRSLVGSLTQQNWNYFAVTRSISFDEWTMALSVMCGREEDAILSLANSLPACDRCDDGGDGNGGGGIRVGQKIPFGFLWCVRAHVRADILRQLACATRCDVNATPVLRHNFWFHGDSFSFRLRRTANGLQPSDHKMRMNKYWNWKPVVACVSARHVCMRIRAAAAAADATQ